MYSWVDIALTLPPKTNGRVFGLLDGTDMLIEASIVLWANAPHGTVAKASHGIVSSVPTRPHKPRVERSASVKGPAWMFRVSWDRRAPQPSLASVTCSFRETLITNVVRTQKTIQATVDNQLPFRNSLATDQKRSKTEFR